MSLRFRAIGFPDVLDEASLAKRLAHVVARARRSADGSLVFKPFAECEIRVLFGLGDLIERVDVCLDSPEQAIMIANYDEAQDGCCVAGFACIDGKPVSPIIFKAPERPEGLEPGDIWFVRMSAFAERLEGDRLDMAPRLCWYPGQGVHWAQCGVLSTRRRVNSISGQAVSIAALAAPGIVLWACTPQCVPDKPGEAVSGVLEIYGEICARAI